MITKITELNQDEYKYLFDEAKNALGVDDINSLDTYFLRIKDLVEKDLRFMVLPLDEETFNIDANTRIISIPKSFNSNGISVQGDNSAEIVFFTIDRYFDSMDLKNKRIFIQWERPDGQKGLSPNFYKNTTLIPGKILFGWVITSDLTEIPGKLKFSVRFWSQDGEDIDYSLSTLVAEIKINSGLNFNLNEIEYIPNEDLENIILSKIENSNAEDLPVPAPPVVLGTSTEGLISAQSNKYKVTYKGYSDLGYLLLKDNSEILYAYGNSDGDILYTWKKQNDLGNWITLPEEDSGVDYISLEDLGETYISPSELGEQGIYYYKENENYFVANSDYVSSNPTNTLYRKVGYLKVSEPGLYKVTLITRQLNNQSENIKNPEVNFYFFDPRELESVVLEENTIILEKNNILYEPILNQLDYTVEQINESAVNNITIEGKSCLYKENDLINNWPDTLDLHFDREFLTYKWYFSRDLAPDSWIELENTDENLIIEKDEEKDFLDSVGYYKVEITNNRNKKSSNTISHYYRLNYKPIAPIEVSLVGFPYIGYVIEAHVKVNGDAEYESIKCEWSINDKVLGNNSTRFTIPEDTKVDSILKCKVQSVLGGKLSDVKEIETKISSAAIYY